MKKLLNSSFRKTATLLAVCAFTLAFTFPDKDKGKYAKIKVIQHQQGKVNVYDTLINTEKYSVENYLNGLGINAEKANILEINEEDDSGLHFIKQGPDGEDASTQQYEQNHEVKIEKNIDEQGNVTIRKWVNGEEVPVDAENFDLEEHDFEIKADSLQKKGLHIEVIKEIEAEEIEDNDIIIRKSVSEKEEGEPKVIRRFKIRGDKEASSLNGDENEPNKFVWKTDNEEVEIIRSDKFAIILQTEEDESANNIMHMEQQEDMTTVIVRYLDEETALNEKPAARVMENKQLKLNKLSFYPNPNQGVFQLTFELPQKAPAQLTIHKGENGGILVHEEKLDEKQQKYNKRIDLTKHGKGLYILTIRQEDKSVTEKILMQ